MKNEKTIGEILGIEPKKRPVTITVSAEELRMLGAEPEMLEIVAKQMDESEGNLKGKFAIGVAKAMVKQLEMKMG